MIEIDGKNIYFPIKHIPRDQQLSALEFIKRSLNCGAKNIILNLGTGVGKTMINAVMITNYYRNFINTNDDVKFDILTNSKVLQNQYIKEFDFISNYKGRNNYYCDRFSCDCSIGKELHTALKTSCNECPYDIAKNKWIHSEIGLTNFHMFSTLSLFQKDILKNRNSNVLIVDEGHLFEDVFSSYLNVVISAKILKNCGFNLKEIETLDDRFISKIKYLDKYLEFLERKLMPMIENKLANFEASIKTSTSKKRIEVGKYIQNLETKLLSFKQLFSSYANDPNNIVLDIEMDKNDKMYSGTKLIGQHIWIHDILNEMVFKNYDHVFFTSATILSKDVFCAVNGLDSKLTSYYEIDTPFKKENRPVYYMKIGKMNINSKEETFQKQIPWINKILEKYKNKKGIIHCTTYEIADWVKDNIQNTRLLFHDTENRDEILEKHLQSTEPTVIVSPSMSGGIDLRGSLAEFSIILKIPFPSLGSKKIVARKQTNKDFYTNATISELLQMYGRTIRSETDRSDTFILDSNFSDLLKYNSDKIPKYFTEAIKVLKI